jgi:hypothetical protein
LSLGGLSDRYFAVSLPLFPTGHSTLAKWRGKSCDTSATLREKTQRRRLAARSLPVDKIRSISRGLAASAAGGGKILPSFLRAPAAALARPRRAGYMCGQGAAP